MASFFQWPHDTDVSMAAQQDLYPAGKFVCELNSKWDAEAWEQGLQEKSYLLQ